MKKSWQIFSLGALVLGNLIGAGILALPISLGLSGMIPSVLLMLVYSSMMLFSAEVLARESAEAKKDNFDFPSLYEHYLGRIGKWIAIATNAIILYGLLIAYIAGGAQIIGDVCGIADPPVWLMLIFALAMTYLTALDLSVINKYNAVLIVGLIAAFSGLIALSAGHIQPDALLVQHWEYAGIAIPLVVTAAHFHNIIPTLTAELKWDLKTFRKAMILGMILAIVMNAAWVLCGIGCMPRHGDNGLIAAFVRSIPATVPMRNILGKPSFTVLAVAFSLTAIVTSFLANGIGLQNFVRDILANTFHKKSVLLVRLVTFAPPIVIALLWPNIFIKALNVVGGIGIVTLFGILPCLIAVIRKKNSALFRGFAAVFLALALLALFFVVGGMCGSKFCTPDPAEECEEDHPGTTYRIDGHLECTFDITDPGHFHMLSE